MLSGTPLTPIGSLEDPGHSRYSQPAVDCHGIVVGPVAQWLEPAAHNGLVGGSSPSRPTKYKPTSEWIAS